MDGRSAANARRCARGASVRADSACAPPALTALPLSHREL